MSRLRDCPHDVARIQQTCAAAGLTLSPLEAVAAWEAHSETMAAGWLGLPAEDDRLVHDVREALATLYGVRP